MAEPNFELMESALTEVRQALQTPMGKATLGHALDIRSQLDQEITSNLALGKEVQQLRERCEAYRELIQILMRRLDKTLFNGDSVNAQVLDIGIRATLKSGGVSHEVFEVLDSHGQRREFQGSIKKAGEPCNTGEFRITLMVGDPKNER